VSDQSVSAALRSNAPLVLVEAAAGCGKTHQGAEYARDIADTHRVLILTHTNAACSVFAERTRDRRTRVEIRTIDGVFAQIGKAYHLGLDLPRDTAAWARQNKEGYAHVALRVADLLKRHPMIPASLARRFPVVICDEHQDCSGDQHSLGIALLRHGARVRIFSDPMQRIYKDTALVGSSPSCDWTSLKTEADAFEQLETPHRWAAGCPELGKWAIHARDTLKAGGTIDLRSNLPPSLNVVVAENQAQRNRGYQLLSSDRRAVDAFEGAQSSLLILTHYNDTARSFRSFFYRRIPLWEGHTRTALQKLADTMLKSSGDRVVLASAVVKFMNEIGKGFSPSSFGDRFEREVLEECSGQARGKPAAIQALAKFLADEPNHRGIAKMLRQLEEFRGTDENFSDVEVDCHNEFWEAIRLGSFDNVEEGFAEITHRRTYSRPKPPAKAISTIHKAKGLECDAAIVMPCDADTFPDRSDTRCLLYVALSRAKNRLMLVVSRNRPSPLLRL
jgi:hypothetical protein